MPRPEKSLPAVTTEADPPTSRPRGPGGIPKEVVRERERIAWELRQQFWTQRRIAEHLGVCQPTVGRMLRRVERRVLAELADQVAQFKIRQTAQLEHLAGEAYAGWERSKLETAAKGGAGDVRFLTEIRRLLAEIRKIWGIDPRAADPEAAAPVDPKIAEAAIAAALAEAQKSREDAS